MISLMQELTSRRDMLAAGIAGAVVLAGRPLAAVAAPASVEPGARLRAIVQAYGGEFGPALKGA